MKAAILRAPHDLSVQEIPMPIRKSDEILVRVKACGICGSDIRYYVGSNPWSLHTLGIDKENPPNIALGHEVTGIVESCPRNHPVLKPGTRVTVLAFKGCGKCKYCRSNRENLCELTEHLGHGAGWNDMEFCPGGMAEYCIAWPDKVYPLPDSISHEEGVFLDGASVAIHAVKCSKIRAGDDVLIFGCGPIGLILLQIARLLGAASVTCVDIQDKPLKLAKLLGADKVFSIKSDNGSTRNIRELVPNGVDVIFDAVGSAKSIEELLSILARGGTMVCLAVKDQSICFNHLCLAGERTITVSANANYEDFPEAIKLMEDGKIKVASMITHRFPLYRVEEAFHVMLDKDAHDALKIVIEP